MLSFILKISCVVSITFTTIMFLFVPILAIADPEDIPLPKTGTYKLLAPITPAYDTAVQGNNIPNYINALIRLIAGGATVLAVVVIVYGGFLYATALDNESRVKEGVKHMQDAVLGLLLLLGSYLLLYTINPQLIELNFKITPISVAPSSPPTPGPRPGVDNPQNVRFFSNPYGREVACIQCAEVGTLPMKPGQCAGQTCLMDATLLPRVERLQQELIGQGINPGDWWITEAWPPTVQHQNPCHENGSCLDINFRTGFSEPRPSGDGPCDSACMAAYHRSQEYTNVANSQEFLNRVSNEANKIEGVINASQRAGFGVQQAVVYEVRTQERANQLIGANPGLAGKIVVVPRITAEHFSLYNR